MMIKLGLRGVSNHDDQESINSNHGIRKHKKLNSLIPNDVSENLWGELNQLAHDQLIEDQKKRKEDAVKRCQDLRANLNQ